MNDKEYTYDIDKYTIGVDTNGEYHYKICTKCGKVKGEPVFWEYEGMGFK